MACRIDHITITSPSLEAGSRLVFERLGVMPQAGGEHPRMGTHNMLLRLGNAMFLEVIAVNPAAAKPQRPRWFELDRQPTAGPGLACWVARTDDIRKSLSGTTEPLGIIEPMTRGPLEWLITIPEDGSLPLSGTAPALIEWHTKSHPALSLEDRGCRLIALELMHPEPDRLSTLVSELSIAEPGVSLTVTRSDVAGLLAAIHTPSGLRTIGDRT
jgi:hypothetical protein